MSDLSNAERAQWAARAVLAHAAATASSTEDLEDQISDLLANLRHLCDLRGLKYSDLHARSFEHWAEEYDAERFGPAEGGDA